MNRRTLEILAELQAKLGEAGKAVFQRLGLAIELLQDDEWIAEQGSLTDAYNFLQKEYFGDICVAAKIETLLEVRKEFPTEKEWEDRKWDLQTMRAELYERRRKDRPTRTRTNSGII